ncbi:hypothetical protein V490_06073 [Pseudogymnoascus sp. VKM F-3557]|nr:hypothetical protein V490_06073 [Pseudogymnoascus sp. VKM F-3557]
MENSDPDLPFMTVMMNAYFYGSRRAKGRIWLVILAIYNSSFRTWTSTLDALAMAKVGSELKHLGLSPIGQKAHGDAEKLVSVSGLVGVVDDDKEMVTLPERSPSQDGGDIQTTVENTHGDIEAHDIDSENHLRLGLGATGVIRSGEPTAWEQELNFMLATWQGPPRFAMLDPLSALSLAAAIVQFVDYGTKIVLSAAEIHASATGSLTKNVELSSISIDLSDISGKLVLDDRTQRDKYSKDEQALSSLAMQCREVASTLLTTLEDLSLKGPHKRWKSVRQALLSVWRESEIRDIRERLDTIRGQLTTRLVATIYNQQSAMNISLQNLTYSHESMKINSANILLELKESLLIASQDAQRDREELTALFSKLSDLTEHGKKLATEQAFLESLNFKRMRDRRANITRAHEKTFNWIFDESAAKTNFSNWLQSRAGIYWITGKAGSGKSTLMKYLVDHHRVKKSLDEWARSKSLVIGAYFFWSGGDTMEKSQLGLLQSLLYDILRVFPSVIPEMSPKRWLNTKNSSGTRSWTQIELLECFEYLTKKRAWPVKFCFFVDGVDEYKGDPAEIVQILEDFAKSPDVKIILSSRHWTEIEEALVPILDQRLLLHKFTTGDINRYIKDLLVSDPRFQRVIEKDGRYEGLVKQISSKAEGVFLWVFLAVRELLKGLTHKDTMLDLEKRLRSIPPDLDEFFQRILNSIEKVYHPQASQIFQMCLAATKPLSLLTFSFLEDEERDPDYAIRAAISPWTNDYMKASCEDIETRVKARCRDFLEITPSFDNDLAQGPRAGMPVFWVDFLHRTVRDFFLGDDMQTCLLSWIKTPFNPHIALCRSFVMQMKIIPPTRDLPSPSRPPFFDLVEDFLYHSRMTEDWQSPIEATLIEDVDRLGIYHYGHRREWGVMHLPLKSTPGTEMLPLGLIGASWKSSWILTLCVQAGLQSYVRKKIQEDRSLVIGIDGRPLLFCALLLPLETTYELLRTYNLEMLSLLLEFGANPNQSHLNISVWNNFLSYCYMRRPDSTTDLRRLIDDTTTEKVLAEVFTLLLNNGADPEVGVATGRSSEKATFSGKVLRYPEYTKASEIIQACCPNEAYNLKVAIERQKGYSIWRMIGWKSVGSSSRSLSEMSVDSDYTPEFSLGMRPETKQLYRADDRSTWDEWNPGNIRADAEAGSFAQECALIVRREPHPSNNNEAALHSITVQSPLIKKALDATFEGVEGLNTQLKQLTFKAPFHPFYYRWHRFEKLRKDEQDEDTKNHLDLLYETLSNEILPHIEVMEDLTKNKVISFEYLWTIFSPGMEVYANIDGHDRIILLRDSRYGASMSGEYFSLECRYIDCDGLRFGYVETSLEIMSFDGVKKIVDLDAFPSHLHPNVEGLVDQLHGRGDKLEQLNGFHHMSYSGFYTARSSRQVRKRHVENGRIIIDPHTFNIYGMPGPNLASIESDAPTDTTDDKLFSGVRDVIYTATSQAFEEYQKVLEKYKMHHKDEFTVRTKTLTPKQRLLCTPLIRGYCLTSKSWAEFDIDNVDQIRWSENAFARLVLPHGYKDIIRAFVQEQLSRDDGFDDIISGKGLGFIMLLSGDPGVGKTLTAESVAEEMHQPLYSMSAGELGETAAEVEDSLELVLELTSKWNAILLLDECDMFLEARTTADIKRNRLISIFLKKLEYYRGVMFLTSNRIDDFDPAFESRIHLTVHYPALDAASRLHIWKTFVRMGNSDSRLSDRDLAILAKNEINGRQIKNIIKTSRLLSKQQKVPLGMEHVEMVLKVKRGDFR